MTFCSVLRRLLLPVALLLLATASVRAEKITIAVLGAEPTEPARSLLTAELSKLPDVQVIERAELASIAGEQSLQANGLSVADGVRIGQLLHADALLLLTTDEKGKQLTIRAMAVAQGVTLSETSHPLPLPEPPKWASITSRKLTPFLANFGTNATPRIPLSILKLHGVNTNLAAEKELAFLLSRRLMNEPSLWVLERSQMGLLEWENALKANPQATYWTGSYLLDGAFTKDPTGYTISARLRAAQKSDELHLTATGADLLTATESLARQVTASLKVQQGGAAWDRTGEAQQYYEEALWAYRWLLYDEASQASEAAWALGLRNDTLALLRFTAESIRLRITVFVEGYSRVPSKPPTWAYESAATALDRLQESLAWKKEEINGDWVGLAASCLSNCAEVVACCYYNDLEPAETEALQSLRPRLREITDSLKPAGARFPLPYLVSKSVGFSLPAFTTSENCLYRVRALWGPLWQDSAAASIEEMKKVFDEMDQIADPRTRARVKALAIVNRPAFAPWIAYRDEAERAAVPLSALKKTLLQSPSPERAIDVALITVERRSHIDLDVYSDHLDSDQTLAALVDLETVLWTSRTALAQKQISLERFKDAMDAISDVQRRTNPYSWPKIDAGLMAFRVKLYAALLTEGIADETVLKELEPWIHEMTPEQKHELAPIVRAAFVRTSFKRLERVATAYENNADIIDGSYGKPVPPRAENEYVHPAWTVTRNQWLGDDQMNSPAVRWREGRIYVGGSLYDPQERRTKGLFRIYDVKTGQTTRLICPLPSETFAFTDVEIFNGDLYALSRGSLIRHLTAVDRWEEIPGLASGMMARIAVLDGIIYTFGDPGNITRYSPATGKVEVLASSRRRPAVTILDDQAPYGVAQVFKDKENQLCTLVGDGKFLRYDEVKKDWVEFSTLEKLIDAPTLDRDLLLHTIGRDGIRSVGNPQMNLTAIIVGLLMQERKAAHEPKPQFVAPRIAAPRMHMPLDARLGIVQYYGQGSMSTGSFDGIDLWIKGLDSTQQRTVLKRLPAADLSEQIIPVETGPRNAGFNMFQQIQAGPDGIFIFDGSNGYFFRREDLLKWEQGDHKETPKPAH